MRARWSDLREGSYGIGKRLRQEIQRIFGVKLSQETLRPLLGELKRQPVLPRRQAATGAPKSLGRATTAEGLPQSGQNASDDQPLSSESEEKPCDCLPALEGAPQTLWCDHVGVLVLAPVLVAVAQVVDPPEALFKQWLASLLLGALNIEQTKFLNWPDLSRLLGAVVRFPHPQRQELERVATQATFKGWPASMPSDWER